jgi:hypothetical protein
MLSVRDKQGDLKKSTVVRDFNFPVSLLKGNTDVYIQLDLEFGHPRNMAETLKEL